MKKVQCEYAGCSRSFASTHNLRRHVSATHLGIRRFECDTCYASFSSKQNLNVHKFRHRRTANWAEIPEGTHGEGEVEGIPKLTELLKTTKDADLRPYSKVLRVYAFPPSQDRPCLPKISNHPQAVQSLPPPF